MDAEDFLAHYGVLGMKWGKRKRNPNYSDQQVKRDKQIYGARGVKRINKNLNKGDQISTARGAEKTRRDRVMGKNKYVRQVGKLAGGVVSGGIGFLAMRGIGAAVSSRSGSVAVRKVLGNDAGILVSGLSRNPVVQATVAAGAARVGYMLSGDIAVGLNMRAHGYDPNRR